VRSDDVYGSKVAATARAEASAVQTALLVVRQAGERRLFGRTLAQALAEAVSDGGNVQATSTPSSHPTIAPTCCAVFDLVRDRLGAGVGLLNLAASFFITLLTLAAEIGGVALSLQLVTSVNYLLFVPVIAVLVWVLCWRVKFELMDNLVGLLGLALLVVAVAVWRAHPHPPPTGRR
jgi:Natural resistance-associated macrophage protein